MSTFIADTFRVPSRASSHPDAALLDAWAALIKAHRDFEYACEVVLPDGGTDEDHEPYYKAIFFFEEQIERLQATTVEGFAVQLRYLFFKKMESIASFNSAVYGDPVSDDLAAALDREFRDKLLWNMVQAATRASRTELMEA